MTITQIFFPDKLITETIDYEMSKSRIFYPEKVDDIEYIVKLPSISTLRSILLESSIYTEIMIQDVYLDEQFLTISIKNILIRII